MSDHQPGSVARQEGADVFEPSAPCAEPGQRVPGSAKGLFVVPEDFDAPLADFREYTESPD